MDWNVEWLRINWIAILPVVEVVSLCREALPLQRLHKWEDDSADPIRVAIGLYSLLGLAITTVVSLPSAPSCFSSSHPRQIKLYKIGTAVHLCTSTYDVDIILPLRCNANWYAPCPFKRAFWRLLAADRWRCRVKGENSIHQRTKRDTRRKRNPPSGTWPPSSQIILRTWAQVQQEEPTSGRGNPLTKAVSSKKNKTIHNRVRNTCYPRSALVWFQKTTTHDSK